MTVNNLALREGGGLQFNLLFKQPHQIFYTFTTSNNHLLIRPRMNRKDFFKYASVAGIGLLAMPGLSSCKVKPDDSPDPTFLEPFALDEITIPELQAKLGRGEFTSRQLTQMYLDRIEQVDRSGPRLNSILELNPEALAIAGRLDMERTEKKLRGPLHGIPILIKGNIDTFDAMHTNAGAAAIGNAKPGQDAHLVKLLRDGGAIILGKTNLSEWANFRSTRSSSGWSSVLGQTRNPYVLACSPCGSSSGSGVAVSANLCAVAVGTETDGSIVCPSAANGIVGIKPTVGLISRSGIIPISHSCDTAGPMARSVSDAVILLTSLTGYDETDTASKKTTAAVDYTQYLDKNGLQGKRIGVAKTFFGFHEGVDLIMDQCKTVIRQAGAQLIELSEFALSPETYQAQWLVLLYEFKAGVNLYLSNLPEDYPVRSLRAVIDYNQCHTNKVMPWFKQEILELAQAKGDLKSQEYLDALHLMKEQSGPLGIDQVMDANNLDAVMAPTGSAAWSIDLINGDHFLGGSSSAGGHGRVSKHHGPGRISAPAAGRPLLFLARL
jgi:amidase